MIKHGRYVVPNARELNGSNQTAESDLLGEACSLRSIADQQDTPICSACAKVAKRSQENAVTFVCDQVRYADDSDWTLPAQCGLARRQPHAVRHDMQTAGQPRVLGDARSGD